MSQMSEEVFGLAIEQTFNDWKSFQLCVEQGMGGQYTTEKLVWMKETIREFFNSNNDLTVEEVADFVAEMIDNEFDSIIDDGSLHMFASSICKYYQLCSSGRQQEVIHKLEDIHRKNMNCVSTNSLKQNDIQLVVENGLQSLSISGEDKPQNRETMDEEIDGQTSDGWTRVQRRNRK